MTNQLSINSAKRIESISIIDIYDAVNAGISNSDRKENIISKQNNIYDKAQEESLVNASSALNSAAAKLEGLYEKIIVKHSEEIANLSIEIARKILAHKIETNDYEIESIVKEVLNNTPSHQDIIVHLNPQDYEQCKKVQAKNSNTTLAGIKLVADSNVGRAECIVKSSKGIVGALIDEQLEKISEALKKIR